MQEVIHVTNEEKILQILLTMQDKMGRIETKLDGIESRMSNMESRMDGMQAQMNAMESRMSNMESRMEGIESRMDGMESRMDGMESQMNDMQSQMGNMESRMDGMESQMNNGFAQVHEELDELKTQQRENTDIIKAVRYNQEHFNAELAGLKLYTASARSVEKLSTKFDVIDARVYKCEVHIEELQKRKTS